MQKTPPFRVKAWFGVWFLIMTSYKRAPHILHRNYYIQHSGSRAGTHCCYYKNLTPALGCRAPLYKR